MIKNKKNFILKEDDNQDTSDQEMQEELKKDR